MPNMPKIRTVMHALLVSSLLGVTASTSADVPSSVIVDGGSSAAVSLQISLTSDFGGDTQTQVLNSGVTGGGIVVFRPDAEPFTEVELANLEFQIGGGTLNYDFLCGGILGCLEVTVTLNNVRAVLDGPTLAGLDGGGFASFNSNWRLLADYTITSSLSNSEGSLDSVSFAPFGSRFTASEGDVFVDQLSLGSIASSLGETAGFQVELVTSFDLSNTSLSGNFDPLPPKACGRGGYCGSIGEAGCDDLNCCIAICELDFYCCETAWDFSCVEKAIEYCGITPDNDDCINARPLELGRHPFTTRNSSNDGPALISECANPVNGGFLQGDVWFTHTPQFDNGVKVSTCGLVDFDTQITIYDSCNGLPLACSDDVQGCPGGSSRVGFQGVSGETYYIRVSGLSSSGSGEIDLAWGDLDDPYAAPAVEWSTSSGGNGHFYAVYAIGSERSFAAATLAAERFGGYLATITSPEEQDFINRNMPAVQNGGNTVIGLVQDGSAPEPADGWGWVTGEPFTWSNWRSGEPNDTAGNEDHVIIYTDGTWNDNSQDFTYALIEFDEDPGVEEVIWSVQDGGEGQRYEAVILPQRITWTQARVYAENRGGTLLCLETTEEADWVFENLSAFSALWTNTAYNTGPWVGLYERDDEWIWLTEEPIDDSLWFPGEPNGTGNRGVYFAAPDFRVGYGETFGPDASGTLFGDAVYADVFGNPRLKLVADGFNGTWGTWLTPPFAGRVTQFIASFRFSFKNVSGGPGDGFSFLWGDLSDTSGNRVQGGELGIFGFLNDGEGLSVGVTSYPAGGNAGIDARWGGNSFVQTPLDFSSVTYTDYATAGLPESMPTMTVYWSEIVGLSVSIAFPFQNPEVVYADQGLDVFAGIDPSNWRFGFAGRNGAIDQDVLIGDFSLLYDYLPETGGLSGGPRNSFDDTYEENVRRSLIIEYPAEPATCAEDFTGDGEVGGADLAQLLANWGVCVDCVTDLDDDDVVGGADLAILLARWGPCLP